MTTSSGVHNPIVAYGKTNDHVLTAQAIEESLILEFDNSSDTIAIGDHVFSGRSDDTTIQYCGKCTASSAVAISVKVPLQQQLEIGDDVWSPIQAVEFLWGTAINNGHDLQENDGTVSFTSSAGSVWQFSNNDAFDLLTLEFQPLNPEDFADWSTFRRTNRNNGLLSFTLAWYDTNRLLSRCAEVKLISHLHSAPLVNKSFAAMSESFHIVSYDTYVTT